MESKQQLLETIGEAEPEHRAYLKCLFQYVPDAIVKAMSYKTFQKEEYLIRAGCDSTTVYLILSGNVAGLDYQKQGKAYYFMDFAKMYIVGDFEVFGDIPQYCVSIYAAEECRVLTLAGASYLAWVRHDENALFLRMKNIMSMLTFETKNERELIFMNCKERLAKYLAEAYENQRGHSFERYKVDKTQPELSDRIGYNVRSVQRGIAALEKEQLLCVENGKITITQEQFLKLKQYQDLS